jgi:PAT family beta-lactamase induction signal transducer AmpG
MIGENIFQSAAFAVVNALALLSIGKDNPFAATQFAFINAAVVAPITYMQFLDGKAYGWGGLTGSFVMDAGLSLAACLVMALLFATRWRDSVTPEPG